MLYAPFPRNQTLPFLAPVLSAGDRIILTTVTSSMTNSSFVVTIFGSVRWSVRMRLPYEMSHTQHLHQHESMRFELHKVMTTMLIRMTKKCNRVSKIFDRAIVN